MGSQQKEKREEWKERFLDAAESGDEALLASMMAGGAKPGACKTDRHGMGALPTASIMEHLGCVEAMLPRMGQDDLQELVYGLRMATGTADRRGAFGATTLIHKRLIELGAAHPALFCQRSKDGFCAEAAALGDKSSMMGWLGLGALHMDHGCGDTAFIRAAQRGQAECLRLLIPMGVDHEPNEHGNNALDMCVAQGHEEASRLLIEAGMKPTPAGKNGWTMLIYAAKFTPGLVEMALPFCDPKAANQHGSTALMMAASCGSDDSVRILLEVSDVEAVDRDGKTAFDQAQSDDGRQMLKARMDWVAAQREKAAIDEATDRGLRRSPKPSL